MEYALIAALLALVTVASLNNFDKDLAKNYKTISKDFSKQKAY